MVRNARLSQIVRNPSRGVLAQRASRAMLRATPTNGEREQWPDAR
jgi:hypothetical protein